VLRLHLDAAAAKDFLEANGKTEPFRKEGSEAAGEGCSK
jgi:hypothetical protein